MNSVLQNELDAMFATHVDRGVLVGADIAVLKDGVPLYRRAWGYRDRERGLPMEPGTVFRYASLTKVVVSTVALRVNELHQIDLNVPITQYLPDFLPALPSGETPAITLRQLMTHTAGLTYGFLQKNDGSYRNAGVSDGLDGAGISNEENVRRISSVPLSYPPGERWGYSVATDVLGTALEHVSKMELEALVRIHVTEPLGMASTSFKPHDRTVIAVPYRDGVPVPGPMQEDEWIAVGPEAVARFMPDRTWIAGTGNSGGAGLFGNVDDYVRFLEAIRLGGDPVLSAPSAQALTTNAVGLLDVTPPGTGWGFGLGVAVLTDPIAAQSPHKAGTWHWSGAYGNYWFVDPARKLSVVLLTNTAFAGMTGDIPNQLRDCIYDNV